jgi:hypothetical protein
MQRIIDTTAVATLPAPPPLAGPAGYFSEGIPGSVAATRARGWWLNMVQEELIALLTAAGITPDTTGTEFNQVLAAINHLIAVSSSSGGAGLAAEIARAEAAEATKASASGLAAEIARAEAAEATKASAAALAAEIARAEAAEATKVPFADLNNPGGLANQVFASGGTTATATVSFTAAGPGWLYSTGGRNNSGQDTLASTATLYINGSPVMTDTTIVSTSHSGAIHISGGGAVTANYVASTNSVAFSVQVMLMFAPDVL